LDYFWDIYILWSLKDDRDYKMIKYITYRIWK